MRTGYTAKSYYKYEKIILILVIREKKNQHIITRRTRYYQPQRTNTDFFIKFSILLLLNNSVNGTRGCDKQKYNITV